MNIGDQLQSATQQLQAVTHCPRHEAELLLASTLSVSTSELFLRFEENMADAQQSCFDQQLSRRLKGEPVAYILKTQGFWNIELSVSPATLIPRPETEKLVGLALHYLPDASCCIADIGTGSGAIACALASERIQWQLHATDLSHDALDVARKNVGDLQLSNVDFFQGSFCHALPQKKYHAIVSNPPYISAQDKHLHQGDVRYEPRQALIADDNGLAALRIIAEQAEHYLLQGGWLMMEHGYDQHQAVTELLVGLGYQDVVDHCDLAGHYRVIVGRKNKEIKQ